MEKDRIAWSYIAKKQTDNPLTGGESGRCLAVSDRF
ncbi:hypothetical protein LRU_01319 [Ligilactobacillus ruminis SPM0211]|uniref:Uncharacterized protein n=1 Tax=Ligilactobacillus ruminis SPM0211 TaxID=1040964 RepID=F7R0W3_9LACO|nr:hypothetical protein LRU_01319 [Ligilactobacillus ruminis SPM0211]